MRSRVFLVLLLVIGHTGCRERGVLPPDETSPTSSVPIVSNSLDPYTILDQMVIAYQAALSYSDHATIRIIGEMSPTHAAPTSKNCRVAFHKPNRIHLEIARGIIVSDGKDCYAQIRSLPNQMVPNQVVYYLAPAQWTLETLFQDVHLDRAMALELPLSVFWFPPQLVLLFANDPLNTFCPKGAKVEWIEQQNIGQTQCDVIQISHSDGNRILWISRENHALLRLDYQPVGLPVPEGFESIEAIRIDITDAQFEWNDELDSFQMQNLQKGTLVPQFDSPTPGLPSPEEHRRLLRLMADNDCYRVIDMYLESTVVQEQSPPKVAPKTFTLSPTWSRPMAGADTMAFLPGETPKLLIPYAGNLVAVFDLLNNEMKTFSPESLDNSVIMNIRCNTLPDNQRIGITTLEGKLYLYDESFKLLPTYNAEPETSKTEQIGDLFFMQQGKEELLLLGIQQGVAADTGIASGVIRAVDVRGNIRWEIPADGIPNQLATAVMQQQNCVLVSCTDPDGSILVLSREGVASDPVNIPFGRHVIWFHALDSTIYALLENVATGDVRFVGLDERGEGQWSRLLPFGEYEVEPVYVPSEKKWLVPSPNGEIFVFDRIGNLIDKFSFGIVPTALLCVDVAGETLLIVTDGEMVSAWTIKAL